MVSSWSIPANFRLTLEVLQLSYLCYWGHFLMDQIYFQCTNMYRTWDGYNLFRNLSLVLQNLDRINFVGYRCVLMKNLLKIFKQVRSERMPWSHCLRTGQSNCPLYSGNADYGLAGVKTHDLPLLTTRQLSFNECIRLKSINGKPLGNCFP